MRTPAETVAHYERVMDRGAALSTADWHIYQDAMTEVAREVHRFAWETPDGDLIVLRNRADFDAALARMLAEREA